MECVTVGGEAAYFRSEWLQFYDIPPDGMVTYIGVDPVPPPSDRAIVKGLLDNDFECIFVLGVLAGSSTSLSTSSPVDIRPIGRLPSSLHLWISGVP